MTDLCGSWLLRNDFMNVFCEIRLVTALFASLHAISPVHVISRTSVELSFNRISLYCTERLWISTPTVDGRICAGGRLRVVSVPDRPSCDFPRLLLGRTSFHDPFRVFEQLFTPLFTSFHAPFHNEPYFQNHCRAERQHHFELLFTLKSIP